ncbi:MAG: hypothetical protein GY928_08975 [Colwellia sp.]|nr:hypothetical protein [Colwellia sp.]
MVAKGILSKFGLAVDIAFNGVKALECLEASLINKPYTLTAKCQKWMDMK